jgi:putative two-component system response regulator
MVADTSQLPAVIACLSRAEAFRDFGTNVHARRVAAIIEQVALQIGLPVEESRQIGEAAIVHDIGKLSVPIDILQKSSRLSPEEVALIKTHSQSGYRILQDTGDATATLAAIIALNHHEKYDGSGYPSGLKGEAIPLPAQITAICDIYDAVRQDRPYARGRDHDDAMRIIVQGDGRTLPQHFDPRVHAAFQQVSDHARSLFEAA